MVSEWEKTISVAGLEKIRRYTRPQGARRKGSENIFARGMRPEPRERRTMRSCSKAHICQNLNGASEKMANRKRVQRRRQEKSKANLTQMGRRRQREISFDWENNQRGTFWLQKTRSLYIGG